VQEGPAEPGDAGNVQGAGPHPSRCPRSTATSAVPAGEEPHLYAASCRLVISPYSMTSIWQPMQVDRLTAAADAVGEMLKYSHQGFLPNIRMLRMGGLAAIELAQTIRIAVCVTPDVELNALLEAADGALLCHAGGTSAGSHAIARER